MKKLNKSMNHLFSSSLRVLILTLVSCGQSLTTVPSSNIRSEVSTDFDYSGDGMIYVVNPIVATNSETISLANYANKIDRLFVTNEPFLQLPLDINQSVTIDNAINITSTDTLMYVKNDRNENTNLLQSIKGSWSFDQTTQSDEFYQVGTFYHAKEMINSFFDSFRFAHTFLHLEDNLSSPPSIAFNYGTTKALWQNNEGLPQSLAIYSKCEIDDFNAFFDPSNNSICYGIDKDQPSLMMSQDPSVIYHELGHALVKTMMNQRNIKYDFINNIRFTDFHSDLGDLFYDEAGAINEGICDYFSYYMNGRHRVGEWAMGRFFLASRPMSENDDVYKEKNILVTGERLSYPQYVNFDTNETTKPFEDIHMAGQIVSHYLVALTESFSNQCAISDLNLGNEANSAINDQIERFKERWQHIYLPDSSDRNRRNFSRELEAFNDKLTKHVFSTTLVLMLINETLAEIGDLYSRGSDLLDPDATGNIGLNSIFFTNMNPENSYLWTQQVNPPNFRRFFQIFSKKIKHHITNGACPSFSLDESEQLLDDYGLLLFKSYEDNKKSTDGLNKISDFNNASLSVFNSQELFVQNSNTLVNELNRRKTVLVSKDFIELPTSGTRAFVFDKASTMQSLLAGLSFEGVSTATTSDVAGIEYNNGNAQISPGEVVGIALNLRNTSNSDIAGLQILANDWDHMKLEDNSNTYVNREINNLNRDGNLANFRPCIFDEWPLETEGGIASEGDSNTAGNCDFFTRTNQAIDTTEVVASKVLPKYALDSPQPVCLVQYSDQNDTKWVSQNYFRKVDLDLDDDDCLNNPQMSGNEFNPNECLIRFLPGASQASFSKLDSQKTWGETMSVGNSSPTFNSSAALVMEVNKWIEPGTTFSCRLRVRFTNCIDCFSKSLSSEEYADFEYTGGDAFKIINFQFTVID